MSNNEKAVLSVFIVFIIVTIICSFFFVLANDISFTTGVYYNDNESETLIVDDAYILLNDSENAIPESIINGNKMLIIHQGILETFPPQINVKVAFKLGDEIVKDANYPILEETIIKNEDLDRNKANEWFAE